eukprot:TRINITY_DN7123_c0_g1_i1.p1 TRINITY_DN7123_c0_g1~~TRINITY_DN7123_c0_g1_i1.p1  ORF type:complete len:1161 (+),score=490.59 TRINITY_DN7123_c0_g1_i1:90-3485(+)
MAIEGKLDLTEHKHKEYRAPRKGKSFEKKKTEDKKKRGLPTDPEKLNPKAFATGRPGTTQAAQKKLDRGQHNAHMPRPDRTFSDVNNEAPQTVAVVGPPGCGKTTLIRSLVKYYTKQNLTSVKGPITCIAGKQRRITFFECPNDVNAMCDMARVADLVLLVVDASFGFEMETFEFLNISKSHGFPKLIGILTHLDKMKDNKQLKKTKKALRHRFWQEICAGAKLFYISGVEKNQYPAKEVVNLNRFIAATKLTPQNWRTTHSCVLADRMEDITDPALVQQQPSCDRKIALYGYVRGCPLKGTQRVHIPGVGDYSLSATNRLEDPCALPTQGNKKKTRHLSERDKRLYAPMADVGGLIYDADAVYVKVDKDLEGAVNEDGEGSRIMKEMLSSGHQAVDMSLKEKKLSLFSGGKAIGDDDDEDDGSDVEMEEEAPYKAVAVTDENGRLRRRVHFADAIVEQDDDEDDDEDDDDDDDDMGVVLPSSRPDSIKHSLSKDDLKGFSLEDDEDDDLLFKVQGSAKLDSSRDVTRDVRGVLEEDWDVETVREAIRDLFVTGNWTKEESTGMTEEAPADNYGEKGYMEVGEDDDEAPMDMDMDEEDEEDEEEDEDEDEESGDEKEGAEEEGAPKPKKLSKLEQLQESVRSLVPASLRDDVKAVPEEEEAPATELDQVAKEKEEYMQKKLAKKKAFDQAYDEGKGEARDVLDVMKQEMEAKHEKTMSLIEEASSGNIDEKIKLVGFYAGLYVRMVIEGVPAEFVSNFNPHLPLLVGGLLASEDRLGVVYARIKKHRWYPKILKAGDPLVLSVGWRRFQTQPIFAIEDPNGRNRYLKYTPLHMHCVAAFYGPVTPPNTGIIAFTNSSLKPEVSHFRCSATGYVMEVDHSSRIVKKLKLTGVPAKVYKNTAFIKNMFSSALEVAKFEGAKLQTVAGLRGTVKKSVTGKGGVFRATFEDKIQRSDIVFLKTWKAMEPSKYYNPVTNLILQQWQAMKTLTELRRENNIAVPYSRDSIYREVKRTKQFNTTLQVPRNVEGNLPFDQKHLRFIEKDGLSKQEAAIAAETAFVLSPEEQKRRDLLERLTKVDNIKKRTEKEAADKKKKVYLKDKEKKDLKAAVRVKELKKKNARLAEFKNMAKRQKR